jgi:hypothetical protein
MDRRTAHVNYEGDGALTWLATLAVTLVSALHPAHHQAHPHSRFTPNRAAAVKASKTVFGPRWRVAVCVAYEESRWELGATNVANLGPWQINTVAHPWADRWRLTHSWLYSARAAYRISDGGRQWSAWTTHGLCGV